MNPTYSYDHYEFGGVRDSGTFLLNSLTEVESKMHVNICSPFILKVVRDKDLLPKILKTCKLPWPICS